MRADKEYVNQFGKACRLDPTQAHTNSHRSISPGDFQRSGRIPQTPEHLLHRPLPDPPVRQVHPDRGDNGGAA